MKLGHDGLAFNIELFRELIHPNLGHVTPVSWPGCSIVEPGPLLPVLTHRCLLIERSSTSRPAFVSPTTQSLLLVLPCWSCRSRCRARRYRRPASRCSRTAVASSGPGRRNARGSPDVARRDRGSADRDVWTHPGPDAARAGRVRRVAPRRPSPLRDAEGRTWPPASCSPHTNAWARPGQPRRVYPPDNAAWPFADAAGPAADASSGVTVIASGGEHRSECRCANQSAGRPGERFALRGRSPAKADSRAQSPAPTCSPDRRPRRR